MNKKPPLIKNTPETALTKNLHAENNQSLSLVENKSFASEGLLKQNSFDFLKKLVYNRFRDGEVIESKLNDVGNDLDFKCKDFIRSELGELCSAGPQSSENWTDFVQKIDNGVEFVGNIGVKDHTKGFNPDSQSDPVSIAEAKENTLDACKDQEKDLDMNSNKFYIARDSPKAISSETRLDNKVLINENAINKEKSFNMSQEILKKIHKKPSGSPKPNVPGLQISSINKEIESLVNYKDIVQPIKPYKNPPDLFMSIMQSKSFKYLEKNTKLPSLKPITPHFFNKKQVPVIRCKSKYN